MRAGRKPSFCFIRTASDSELLAQIDELVAAAVAGDRRAITAIAVGYGPTLMEEARKALGQEREQDAGDVVQAFLLAMVAGGLRFQPELESGLSWLKATVRAIAAREEPSFEPFPCPECGGCVRMLPPSGERWDEGGGAPVAIPESVLVPKCDRCGESYMSEADEARVARGARDASRGIHAGVGVTDVASCSDRVRRGQ